MTKLGAIFPLLLLASCSSINVSSSSIIPISLEENKNHFQEVKIKVEKSHYLWGLMPKNSLIEVDKLFEAKGLDSVSSLQMVEVDTMKKVGWMLITLGLYYPQTIEFRAKATQ